MAIVWHDNKGSKGLLLLEFKLAEPNFEECSKAIELDPNLVMAYVNRAATYNSKGQYDLGIAALEAMGCGTNHMNQHRILTIQVQH